MYEFGNWLTRALRGGVALSPAEQWLLAQLVAALPEHLIATVQAQLRSYNLAQREIDGRAINFYRRPALSPQMPLLPMSTAEAPLVRLTASLVPGEPVHATLNAVTGRVFCMALNRSVQGVPASVLRVIQVTQAWRSNFPVCAPNNSFKPTPLRGAA
jgi:hypothetical protein